MSLPPARWRDAARAPRSRDWDFLPGFPTTGWRGRVRRASSVRSRRSRGCPRWSASPRCRPPVAPAGCAGTRAAAATDFLDTRRSNGAGSNPSGTWTRSRRETSSPAEEGERRGGGINEDYKFLIIKSLQNHHFFKLFSSSFLLVTAVEVPLICVFRHDTQITIFGPY